MPFHCGVAQPHDHLFRLVFGDPEHAVPLLRSALPPAVAGAIDWRTLRRCARSHQGRRGRQTVCDVLFSARLRSGRPLLLYVVLEHKSRSTRFDALQMLEQVTAILRTHRREHPRDRFLPLVLPVVVHADHRPWRSPLQVRELFDLEHLPRELHRFLPALEFVLDDLHDSPPERLRQRALSVFGLCTLSTLQYLPPAARDRHRLAAWVDAWVDVQTAAARLAESIPGSDVFEAVVEFVLATSDLPRPVVQRVLARHWTDPAMKKKFVSTLTQTRNEGRALGKAEGKAMGKAEGKADTVMRQLARRFGVETAAAAEPRVRAASLADLDRFTDQILDAATIDDVFAGT